MSRTRSRVYAPIAAALLVSLAFVAPAAATESAGGIGRETSSSASNGKSSAGNNKGVGSQKSSADRSSSRASESKPARADAGTTRSAEGKAPTGTEEESSSSNAAVQHERPNDFQAQADPDGDSNGGVDQPDGDGGMDTNDQDGNNGSGNDSDCEDDNRGKGVPGHCKDKPESTILADDADVLGGEAEVLGGEAEVLGVQAMAGTVPAGVVPVEAGGPEAAQVLGVAQTAAPSTGILPQTGATEDLRLLMLTGLGLVAAGAVTVLARRRLQAGR